MYTNIDGLYCTTWKATVTEDGQSMLQGTWVGEGVDGTWSATRFDEAAALAKRHTEEAAQAEAIQAAEEVRAETGSLRRSRVRLSSSRPFPFLLPLRSGLSAAALLVVIRWRCTRKCVS